MTNHFIAWWNLENLFDIHQSTERPEWLQKQLNSELKGWDSAVLDNKLNQLASVILQMNDSKGPDVLGICEVENKPVVEALMAKINIPGRDYDVIHHPSDDQRGIDIVFVYDKNKWNFNGDLFHYVVLKRNATRDILQATLSTKAGKEIIFIGNHWPARLGGELESEPYRIIAAETLSYWLERIQEIKGKDMPILVMGDFNDEPFSRSLTDYALSCSSKKKVIYARNPALYNLMWEPMGQASASYMDGSEPVMLDQFMVSKGLLKSDAKLKYKDSSTRIEVFDGMAKGRYKSPRRFSRPSAGASYDPKGYSDHFPISMQLTEH